jgi:hypothetical protein
VKPLGEGRTDGVTNRLVTLRFDSVLLP